MDRTKRRWLRYSKRFRAKMSKPGKYNGLIIVKRVHTVSLHRILWKISDTK